MQKTPSIESSFSYLKREDLYRRGYKSEAAFLRGIDKYILFYNSWRTHSTLQCKIPNRMQEEAPIPGNKVAYIWTHGFESGKNLIFVYRNERFWFLMSSLHKKDKLKNARI